MVVCFVNPAYAQNSTDKTLIDSLLEYTTMITAFATAALVVLLYIQTRHQQRATRLTIRPIILLDQDHPDNPAIYLSDPDNATTNPMESNAGNNIHIRMINTGDIPTGKMRTILLPPDTHMGFVNRERALKDYIARLPDDDLVQDGTCIILDSIRERIKHSKKHYFEKYLIVGDEMKQLKKASDAFNELLNSADPDGKFNEAGLARAASLEPLNPDDWEEFYMSGHKRGHILDLTGPVDWESFDKDSSITRDEVLDILKEDDGKRIYAGEARRKEIINNMHPAIRKNFDEAIRVRQDLWNQFSNDITKDFTRYSMELRKTYKNVKDILVREVNMFAPKHPIVYKIPLDKTELERINNGSYVYFGILVQYAMPDKKEFEYTYYLQGYFKDKSPYVDYTLDVLDND